MEEDFREIGARLSNWNRWGADDEKGTTNFITPDKVVAAAALIRTGKIFDLGIAFDSDGPQTGAGRLNPVHLMRATGQGQDFPGGFRYSDDVVFMPLQASSQWDGLAHVFYDEQLYNGYPADTIGPQGATKLGIDKQGKGIAGRGVLLDIARLKGVRRLEASYEITPQDLDAAAERQGVSVGTGDILLFRTGWRTVFTETRSATSFKATEPGIGLACCQWLYDHEVAALCSDNWCIEVVPGPSSDRLPVHCVLIRDLGLTLGEMLDFEDLASDCEQDGVWDFFFVAPPIKFTRAVGSPVNPLAFK